MSLNNPQLQPKEPQTKINQQGGLIDRLMEQGQIATWCRMLAAVIILGILGVADEAEAFKGVQLKYLSALEPKPDNLDSESVFFLSEVNQDQLPYLWFCDPVANKDKEGSHDAKSPSLVFDVFKKVHSDIHSILGTHNDRLRRLGLLKQILDAYKVNAEAFGGDTAPDFQKRFDKLNEIYNANLENTQALIRLWKPLMEQATALRTEIKNLVTEEVAAGTKTKKCAKKRKDLEDSDLLNLLPKSIPSEDIGAYQNYDKLMPKGIFITPYTGCGKISPKDLSKTNSEPYLWVNLLERIVTEHVFVAMERERAYIENVDRAQGALGSENKQKKEALMEAAKGQAENKKFLQKWKAILEKITNLKINIQDAVEQESQLAKEMKRCVRRVNTADAETDVAL